MIYRYIHTCLLSVVHHGRKGKFHFQTMKQILKFTKKKMNLVRFHYGENNINTGPLKEIPEICVDHFFGDDLNSCVFFLSHAHTDHLVGLETDAFVRRLRQPGIKLYCHPITPILLGSFQRYLGGPEGIKKLIGEKKIIPLDVKRPMPLKIHRASGYLNVTVTLLPAGHCPGSVMFLFETSNYRILHTGDFRLELEDLKRMSYLHDDNNKLQPKSIDHLYVDTTFCSTSANLFPNRKNVLNEAIQHIREWIGISKEHVVDLRFSAKFAHEYVLLELNRRFGQKIHVTPERRDIYKNIPELYEIVTLDNSSQFHLCGNRYCVEEGEISTIRLSSMWYTKGNKSEKEDREHIAWHGKNMTLCYSMHSSLKEIARTIDYLKPRIVTPLVLPKNSNLSEVEDALRSATLFSFEFRDYHSSRNIFGEATQTETLLPEERDTTYMEEDVAVEIAQSTSNVSPEPELYEHTQPKRPRLAEDIKNVWRYNFSPSPKSKSSQGSSDEASQSTNDGSQEDFLVSTNNPGSCVLENASLVDDNKEISFLLPQPPRDVHWRRKLDFLSQSSGSVDMNVNDDTECQQNDSDTTTDSQFL